MHSSGRRKSSGQHTGPLLPVEGELSPDKRLHNDCMRVLDLLETLGLSLGDLIHAIFYGNPESRPQAKMRGARNSFIRTDKFPQFLNNLYNPPRPPNGGGTVPTSGRDALIRFASTTMQAMYARELGDFSEGYIVAKEDLVNYETLSAINSNNLHAEMVTKCPYLWGTLSTLAGNELGEVQKEQAEDSGQELAEESLDGYQTAIKPHPHFGTILCIASLAYRFNRRKNKLQMVLTGYIHARHTSKAVHELLHQAGIVLSHSWMMELIATLSKTKHAQAISVAATRPIILVHDNIRLKFPVQSQRGNNQSVSDNGTAISMLALGESGRAFNDSDDFGPFMRQLKAKRKNGTAPSLTWLDISQPDRLKRVKSDYVMDVLDFLIMCPGMKESRVLRSHTLARIPGPQQLPHGKQHRSELYMLPTVNIDEMTYGGNSQVIEFTLKYLELDTGAKRDRLAIDRKVPWVGDQTTAQRCTTFQFFRNECRNPYDRLEPFMFLFGGFHCEMALGAGTFETSQGTSSGGATFARDAILLSRTGLNANMNKTRPNFHTCDEFLLHELEARMRAVFLLESGTASEAELFDWVESHTPEEVLALATKVYANHASTGALHRLARSGSTDETRPTTILQNSNLLRYYAYRTANRHGRIDRIEDLLHELLVFFSGSGNSNYAKELYGFLQLLTHECTPNLKAAILQNCLLVNMQGRANSFYPIDQRQEHNNGGIRNHGPQGKNSSWEQFQKISPIIPYYMENVRHVEEQISGQTHSHIHKDPKREGEIQALMRSHNGSKIHVDVPGRTIDPKDKSKDCMLAGTKLLKLHKLADYARKREVYFRGISDETTYDDKDTPPPTPPATPPPSPPPAQLPSSPLFPPSPMPISRPISPAVDLCTS